MKKLYYNFDKYQYNKNNQRLNSLSQTYKKHQIVQMEAQQIYNILHKKTQIHGDTRNSLQYLIVKKYEDPGAAIKSKQIASGKYRIKNKELKRGHYLEDEYALKKGIPGPGRYQLAHSWSTKKLSKPRNKSEKKTYLDEAMQIAKKQKVPAPGYYDVIKQMGKDSIRPVNSQKHIKTEKIDYLDNAQYYGALTPGVGEYNISRYQKSLSHQHMPKFQKNQQFWIQKHKQHSLRQLPRAPDAGSYDPKPLTYQLFGQKSKTRQFQSYDKSMQLRQRTKTESNAANLGPGKYNIIHQWKDGKRNQKGLLDTISKGIPQRVYY